MNTLFENVSQEWQNLLTLPELKEIIPEIEKTKITPQLNKIFEFARLTPLDFRVVVLGQDPYPIEGDAHGLAFSSLRGVPGSLRNIFKCMVHTGVISKAPTSGNLTYLAERGVLFLNTALTTIVGQSNAHKTLWRDYIRRLITKISKTGGGRQLAFFLWGNNAKEMKPYIHEGCQVYEYSHPSPLAPSFLECPHFVDVNKYLHEPIEWDPAKKEDKGVVGNAFGMDVKDKTVVFTDGSCYPNKLCPEGRGGYAAYFALGLFEGTKIFGNLDTSEVFASNQRAEGIAILSVLEFLSGTSSNSSQKEAPPSWKELVIVTDSEFWINMFTDYMPKWQPSKFDEKKNPDITKKAWRLYSKLIVNHAIEFRHIESHNKNGWRDFEEGTYEKFCYDHNAYVDELATYARENVESGKRIVK